MSKITLLAPFLAWSLVACHSAGRFSSASQASLVEQEIRRVDLERTEALRSGDVAKLAELYSDDFTMITSTGEIRTKQDQLRDISSGLLQHQGPPPKILRLNVYGDVAVVQSESTGELLVNGQPDDVTRRYTRVYVKHRGKWQLTATHISRVAPRTSDSAPPNPSLPRTSPGHSPGFGR